MTLFLLLGDARLVEDIPMRIVFHGATGTVEAGGALEAANDAGDQALRFADAQRMEARS
jgi:putative ABC transport system ATP-binding protein